LTEFAAAQRPPAPFHQFSVVDLGHRLAEDMPSWPTHARYTHDLVESYRTGQPSCHYKLTMSEHTGTHLDAPLHFIPDGPAHYGIDEVPPVIARAATIDATGLAPGDALGRDHIARWEREQGGIEAGDAVLVRFGWDTRWGSADFLADWPGVGEDAAAYLVDKGVVLAATDALSIDVFGSASFPAHHTLLGNRVLIGENFNNLASLPPLCFLIASPLRITDGSGSPVRPIALVERPGSPGSRSA
jgi:kynurenine formamidase